ncbi:MAG: nucleoside triphosphate pyrophosphohydrolase [Acidobacteriota bacterium]
MTPPPAAADEFVRLVEIVRVLRSPDGCPWDREQTLQTLRPFVLEETYEVLETLDRNDRSALMEELGDFVFEAVLLAQLCAEDGDFTIADSLKSVSDKLIRRHPHVFPPADESHPYASAPKPSSAGEVLGRWEDLKARETPRANTPRTTLSGVPTTQPALLRAHEIGTRAAAVGFDWERAADVVTKIEEEVAELREAVESGSTTDRRLAEEEMGDLLFAIANLSRKLGVEPESALRMANNKFTRRFDMMELGLRGSGRALRDCTLEDMEDEWGRVKLTERGAAPSPDPPQATGR